MGDTVFKGHIFSILEIPYSYLLRQSFCLKKQWMNGRHVGVLLLYTADLFKGDL